MNYKKSFYNIEIDRKLNNKILMYNSCSGALALMDKNTYDLYSNIDKLENFDKVGINEINEMYDNGFIIDETVDEFKKIELINRLSRYNTSGSLHITIAPTLRCNMKCPYCYEKKGHKDMSSEVQEKLIDYISKYLKKHNEIKNLDVSWYGGEPLLVKDIIINLSEKLISYCKENNINYTSTIITNGVLLDKITAKELSEKCLIKNVQITLDGIEETNNKTRMLKSGENSFKLITKNIESVKEIIRISVRVNVSKENSNECTLLSDYFIKQNWNEIVDLYFAPVQDSEYSDEKTSNIVYNCEEFNDKLVDLQNNLVQSNIYNNLNYPINFEGCSALSVHNLVIDPEGNFYKCWHRINLPEHQIGNIFEGIKLNNEYTSWLLLDIPDKCVKCKTFPICRSGCPEKRFLDENADICEYPEDHIKKVIDIYYSNMYSQNNKILEEV
ncbi:radical SAM/SPASM domain Clo7bot peptide maturase [Clostridium sp. CTA-19]